MISLSWKNLSGHNPSRLGTLWLLALALITSNASAGDKIVFSDDQPKSANPADIKPANELFRSWNTKLETPNFDYSILGIPTIPRATLDRKDQRRQKNEQTERQQWMFLRPGELQQKEEERTALGVANRPMENLDKEDGNKDYTFSNLNDKTAPRQRQPGEIRSGNQTASREEQAALAAQQQREREDSDADSSRHDRTFTLPGQKPQAGTYPPGEASLASLFSPGKRDISSADAAKGEFSLPDVFTTLPARPDKDRMKDFYSLLKSSGSDAMPSGGNGLLSPPGSASTAPAFSRPSDSFSRPGGGNNPFDSGSSPNAGYPQSRLTSPGLPTFNNSPGLPGSSPFYPQAPPAQSPSRNWASPPLDPPRRKI